MVSTTSRRSRAGALLAALLLVPLLALLPVPARAEAGDNLVTNGSFEQFDGELPDSWSKWAAAGSGTVARTPGVVGANALSITTDTTSSRLAVVQDTTLPAGAELLKVTYRHRLTGISGSGLAGIRLNVLDGSGGSQFVGSNADTDGWETVTDYMRVPADATTVRVHVFNDMVAGTMEIDDVRLEAVPGADALVATLTAAGDVGLRWIVDDAAGVHEYDVYRSPAGDAPDPATDEPVRTVPASLTEATDQDWRPGASYRYLVVARDAAGAELFRTTEATFDTPETSNILTSSLAAIELDGAAHVSWAAAAGQAGPFALYAADASLADGDLSGAALVADGLDAVGAADLDTDNAHFAFVAGDDVLATASLAGSAHPRIMLDDAVLAKIDRLVAEPGTPRQLWETVLARVDGGMANAGTSAARYSREAAFVYQVTGDDAYADLAFEAFEAAAEAAPFGAKQELDTANPTSHLALTYDWAYTAWTEEQREYAREFFERTSVFLELGDHPNMVWEDKASNWTGVTRGAELAQHLAVRGDGDYGTRDARIARLLDQLDRHVEQANTDQGWFQEGLNYLDYDNMIMTSGVLGSFDAGIDTLKDDWYEPATSDLLYHAVSLRDQGGSLQWGVGTGTGAVAFPLYLDRATEDGTAATMVELYERTQGHRAAGQWYSPAFALYAFAYWPEDVADADAYDPEAVVPALLDDEAGSYMFRNRIADEDDVLLALNNRNHRHIGWSGFDSFGISLIADDTAWATQPGKDQRNASKYSRVLVDGDPTQEVGQGRTLASRGYAGQGGGYVRLDGSDNLRVDSAVREAAVDMSARDGADTVVAISDSFEDSEEHTWTWQLAPEDGVTAEIGDVVDGTRQFTLRHGDAWLRGWLLDADGAEVSFSDGVLSLTRTGSAADFDLVLAVGRGTEAPSADVTGSKVRVDGSTFDLARLGEIDPTRADGQAWQRPGGTR